MIQPKIIVCADNSDELFGSRVYENSSLTGNFEDYNINDPIPLVESKFRAISHKNARGMGNHWAVLVRCDSVFCIKIRSRR